MTEASLENQGKKWYPEQDTVLLAMFDNGDLLTEMACTLKRSPHAILARLEMLGKVTNLNFKYYALTPIMDQHELKALNDAYKAAAEAEMACKSGVY